jgi:hypothetical protein
MAQHHHVHIHLYHGSHATQDAGNFEESKHKREGGKFASTGGSGGTHTPVTSASRFAAKHNPAAAAAAKRAAANKGGGPESEEEIGNQKAAML